MEISRKKIIVSGGSGLVGSRVVELLSSKYDLNLYGRGDGFEITDPNSFSILNSSADYFLHLAAKADVDGSEVEKEMGEESEAWKVNVGGTKNVADFCKENGIKLIYISTDFVFDGEKKEGEFYTEEDTPNPINFYAKTKYEGERAVENSGAEFAILRIAYPYRKEFEKKKDFVRAILDRLSQGLPVKAITNHIMCPTFIDDIANVIDRIIETGETGIFHAVGATPLSPYDAAVKIQEIFDLDKNLIGTTTREEFFEGKAKRPFNLYLRNGRIENLGVKMKTFEQGLYELKKS